MRSVVSGLEARLEEKEKLSSTLERDLVAAREEAKERSERCASLSSTVDQLRGEKERLEKEVCVRERVSEYGGRFLIY